jgi:spermidine synthase
MDTADGRSERLLVDVALEALRGDGLSVLVGGLGVGFSLARAAARPRWGRITVVEREQAVVDWHRTGPLAPFSGHALKDPRVTVVREDLLVHLRTTADRYDALCLDVDNGPDWTVTESNGSLYSPDGLARCRERLAPGGVLAVWSARPSAAFEEALRNAGFVRVRTVTVPVARGVPDVVHIAERAPGPA